MRAIWSIFAKEFRGFVFNPSFLIVCGLCSTVLSWVYPNQLALFSADLQNYVFAQQMPPQQLNIHYAVFLRHLSYLNLLLILIVPALTMRLFAEEKKMRTFDLLLTSPITSAQIVAGKYLAALGAVGTLVLIAFLYPAATGLFTKFNWGTLLIAFAGIFLVAAVYAAMNMFCSSITESAIVAYVMAVVFNVLIWFLGMGVEVVDSNVARAVFEHISLNSHLAAFVEGTVRSTSLVFFFSIVFLFTFLSERTVEASRWR